VGRTEVSTGKSVAHSNSEHVAWPVTDFLQNCLHTVAAGRHHVLLIGAQHLVTSFYAGYIAESLPLPSSEESDEIAAAYAGAGLKVDASVRPVRAPGAAVASSRFLHRDRATTEFRLAAHGILLLRDLSAFNPLVLERIGNALHAERQSPDTFSDGSRRGVAQVVATMGACACGQLGKPLVEDQDPCRCSATEIAEHVRRIPLVFRSAIDVIVAVPFLDFDFTGSYIPSVDSRREGIAAAWNQDRRLAERVSPVDRLTDTAVKCVESFSPAGLRAGELEGKLIRVAATISNLAGTIAITDTDIRSAAVLVLPMCTFGESAARVEQRLGATR
jgi:predicted ATPase with chaperone activity